MRAHSLSHNSSRSLCSAPPAHSTRTLGTRLVAMSKPASIKLFDLVPGASPYAQRVKIVLQEKGLPYDIESFEKNAKPQEFLDVFRSATSNPNGRGTVPTIIDGDVKLTESHVISEYLDTAYPNAGPKLLPTDPKLLAQVRLFIELHTSEVQANQRALAAAKTHDEFRQALNTWLAGIKILDAFLKDHGRPGGDFLLGSDFSYAEAATLPPLYRAFLSLENLRDTDVWQLVEEHKLERFASWAKAGFARPSFKATLPAHEVLVARLKANLNVQPLQ